MRLTIAAVGRLKAGAFADLQALYAGRILWPLTIREVEERRKLSPAELKEREGALLLAAIPEGALPIPLDPAGEAMTSERVAALVQGWRERGQDVAFLIGGAEGLSAKARGTGFALSLGPATWPHFLARIMLLEQIYRAQQILGGHPYHRG